MSNQINYRQPFFSQISDSLFILKIGSEAEEIDVGIYENEFVQVENSSLVEKYLIYNENLEYQEMFEMMDMSRIPPPYAIVDDVIYMGFDFHPVLNSIFSTEDIPPLESVPDLQSSFAETSLSNLTVGYDMGNNLLTEVFSVSGIPVVSLSSPTIGHAEPWPGFLEYTGLRNYRENTVPLVLVNDSLLVFHFQAIGDHSLNGLQDLSTSTGQVGLGVVKKNLETGETEMTAMGASGKNIFTYGLYPSENPNTYYRTGFVQGENIPFNQAGENFPFAPDNNSGVAFFAKDNVNGTTEWVVPLFSFINQLYGSSSGSEPNNNAGFRNRCKFGSPIEFSEKVYIPLRTQFRVSNGNENQPEPDSLIFTDFFGQQTTTNPYLPLIASNGDVDSLFRVEQPLSCIKVIDNMGVPERVLKFIDKTHVFNSFPMAYQNKLFATGDSLAWINYYNLESDTTYQLINATTSELADTIALDLPAGKGVFLLWLDESLNILDTWIFPSGSQADNDILQISHIHPMSGDSIFVQGHIPQGSTTTLDIFGSSPPETYNLSKGFFAIYGEGEPVSTDEKSPAKELSIYPNPAKSSIQITGITESGELRIFDISGRLVISKRVLPQGEPARLDISALSPGVYTAVFRGATTSGAGKFVKQ
ncbi:MAG: T9SS type A sorting domain-containing protein [Cryomorphaceae bacterium]|nr:T9SS type A sorting domain-containing protein [Flavobacteriales bacterium]